MSDEGDEELIVAAGLFDFAADRGLVWMGSDEVGGDLAQQCDVCRPVVLAVSGDILAEPDVEHPMQFVFDLPMGSGHLDEGSSLDDRGEQEVADMAGQTAIGMAAGCLDGADGLRAGKGDNIDGDDAGAASIAAVMVILGGGLDTVEWLDVVQTSNRLGQEAGLIGLQRQA